MSIPHPDSVGKVQKILLFETVFHDSASDCTKLTLGHRNLQSTLRYAEVDQATVKQDLLEYQRRKGRRR